MIKFIKTVDKNNQFDITEVVFTVMEGATLSQMLEEYRNFLRGIGYSVDGDLEIVQNTDSSEDVG